MEPAEVFLKYCKIRGILPEIKSIENYKKVKTFLLWNCRDKPLSLREFINNITEVYGFSSLFYDIERNWRKFPNNEIYLKAKKLWNGFVRNNIKIKNEPKVGDKILILFKYMGDIENSVTGEFLYFDPSYEFVTLKLDSGRVNTFKAKHIKTLNDKPYKLDFYIKWKGKEYGNN